MRDSMLVQEEELEETCSDRKNVLSLLQIASEKLLERFVPPRSWMEVGNEFDLSMFCETEILVQVEKYWLGNLPTTLAERLLNDAMAKYDNQLGIQRLLLLYLVLVENVGQCSRLSTPLYLYHWFHGRILVLERLLESGVLANVKELSLDMYNFYHRQGLGLSWARNIDPEMELERIRLERREAILLEDVLSRLKNVVILKIHTVCTNSMLNIISRVCNNLISIDISFSKHVTDDGMENICDAQSCLPATLKQIMLDGTSVTSKSVLCLLENFPHLVNIDSSLMEKFLLSMQTFFQGSSFIETFNTNEASTGCYQLKTLKLCIRKFSEHNPSIAQLIPILFPHLEDLVIHHVHPREFESLVHLKNLPQLKSFMIGGVQLQHIVHVLDSVGSHLTQLRFLCYGGNSGKINIGLVTSSCPNLRTLTLSGNSVICDQDWPPQQTSLLPQLQELHVNTHAYIPYQVWSTLLTVCTQLTCLEMTSCEGLWDGSLASLLEKYPQCLSKMTRLCIRGNHRGDISLTERSVSLVRRRCPDLVQLGDCFTWSMAGVASTGQRIWGPVQRAGSRGL